MPKKKRLYGTQKTTTKSGKREYMASYMKEYRLKERQLIQKARRDLGLSTRVRKTQKKPKRRQK